MEKSEGFHWVCAIICKCQDEKIEGVAIGNNIHRVDIHKATTILFTDA